MMGQGGSSMFYLVAIFLVTYLVGMTIFIVSGKVRAAVRKRRDSRFGGNENG